MKKEFVLLGIGFALMLILAGSSGATLIEVSVETDKDVYQLGEDVTVFVTAYNPNQESVILGFGSSLTSTYLMDGHFDWSEGKVFVPSGSLLTIQANESFTWNRTHGIRERELYALDVGVHSVVGEVVGHGQSDAISFEVIPEPATLLLLLVGVPIIRKLKT